MVTTTIFVDVLKTLVKNRKNGNSKIFRSTFNLGIESGVVE